MKRIFIWVAVGVVWVAMASAVGAKETKVAVAPEVGGAWVVPEAAWDGRAVLLLHGFADDMDGAGDLTKRLAEALEAHGIASLRINFRGEGDRLREKIESTLAMRILDTEAARAWVVKQPGVKAERVGVMGWSLGATTAIMVGSGHAGWFRTMVLWSSPSGDQFKQMTERPVAQEALREGIATEVVPGWKSITTKREFYESFRGVELDVALAKYPGALLTVRGSEDFLPQRDAALMKIAQGRPAEAVVIGGADHIFNVFQPELGHAARAVAVTVGWLERTL